MGVVVEWEQGRRREQVSGDAECVLLNPALADALAHPGLPLFDRWTDEGDGTMCLRSGRLKMTPQRQPPPKVPPRVPLGHVAFPGVRLYLASDGEWFVARVLRTVEHVALKGGAVVPASTPAAKLLVALPLPDFVHLSAGGFAFAPPPSTAQRSVVAAGGLLAVAQVTTPISTLGDHTDADGPLLALLGDQWTPVELIA